MPPRFYGGVVHYTRASPKDASIPFRVLQRLSHHLIPVAILLNFSPKTKGNCCAWFPLSLCDKNIASSTQSDGWITARASYSRLAQHSRFGRSCRRRCVVISGGEINLLLYSLPFNLTTIRHDEMTESSDSPSRASRVFHLNLLSPERSPCGLHSDVILKRAFKS